jgi:uncharacterized protein (PEP-CTERM system associated)
MCLRLPARPIPGCGAPIRRAVLGLVLGTAAAVQAQPAPDMSGAGGAVAPGTTPTPGTIGEGLQAPRRGVGWWNEASIGTEVTLTNNANYGSGGPREGDIIINVTPAISVNRQGARARLSGTAALDLVAYVDGTQTSRILPQVSLLGNVEAVENLFFIDGSIYANQSIINPYLPRPDFTSTENQYTYATARLAPYLTGNIGQNVTWLIRSDNSYTWTTQTDAELGNTYFVANLAQVVRRPTPLGLTLRLTNDITRVENQVQPNQTLNTALAILDYSFTPQLTMGLRGGYEDTNYTLTNTSGPIYGANIEWRPSPVSNLIGYWEQRFYGPSYQFNASHRQRRISTSASFYRTISTYPQALLQIPSTTNVAGVLDAILTSRIPDPVERAQQVSDLMARQGLPETLPGGSVIYNLSPNILTGANASLGVLGVRNTLVFSLFYTKTETLPDSRIPPSFLTFNNNEEYGGGITLSHRVTPVVDLTGNISGYQTKGFGPSEGLDTWQALASVSVNWQVSPRSTFYLGARYEFSTQRETATVPSSQSSAASIFAGLLHRI